MATTYFDKIMAGTATMSEFEELSDQWSTDKTLQTVPCSVYLGVSREAFWAMVLAPDEALFLEALNVIRTEHQESV